VLNGPLDLGLVVPGCVYTPRKTCFRPALDVSRRLAAAPPAALGLSSELA